MLANLDALLWRKAWLVTALVAIVLVTFWSSRITGAAVEKDAGETLQMAVNLRHHGIASMDQQAPFHPSMTREPLPVVVSATLMAVADSVVGEAPPSAYFSGDRARWLKFQNVVWLALLCAVVFGSVVFFTASPTAGLVAVLLVNVPLFDATNGRYLLNSLYTEAPAALLLALGSWLLAMAVGRGSWRYSAAAGVSFAMLALVKAVFLYVTVGLLLVLALARILAPRSAGPLMRWPHLLVLVLSFAAAVTPWMFRNQAALGQFEISTRGGEVLYHRAVEDRLSAEEIRGALSHWARWPVNGILRRVFGFSHADFERGGRLQRLNRGAQSSFAADDLEAERTGRPEDAISNYRKSRAELSRLVIQLRAQGHAEPVIEANRIQKRLALQMIMERPVRHLAMTPLFLWRGAFWAFPVLLVGLAWAAWQRAYAFALYLAPAFGMIMFYGLFSHFIERYSLPTYPIVITTLVVLALAWARRAPIALQVAERTL